MSKVKIDDLPSDSELSQEELDAVAGGTGLSPATPVAVPRIRQIPGANCGISIASNGGGPDIPIAPVTDKTKV